MPLKTPCEKNRTNSSANPIELGHWKVIVRHSDPYQWNINNFSLKTCLLSECRSNSMGAVMTRNSEMFSCLLSDTEEHFRQHRDSLSPRAENRSAGIHPKPELNVTSSSSSSEESRDDRAASADSDVSKRQKIKENYTTFHSDLSNSQSLTHQDQCCPGFTMPKSGKTRHQNNGCCIA